MLRRPLTFGVFFGLATFLSVNVEVGAQEPASLVAVDDLHWNVLADDEKQIIERMAAAFYEETLRHAQSSAIEAQTASIYASGDEEARARFVKDRRTRWRQMNEAERQALRNAKTPQYGNLTEGQKAPFRRHALDQLGAKGAINEDALATALRSEI